MMSSELRILALSITGRTSRLDTYEKVVVLGASQRSMTLP